MATHSIPKIWRKAKVTAIEKPDKDPKLAASYCPVSLLSAGYKLLECLAFQSIFFLQSKSCLAQIRLVSGKPGALVTRSLS